MNECYNCGHDIEDHVLLKCHPTAGYETGCIGTNSCKCHQYKHVTIKI